MSLPIPNLDERMFEELVGEAWKQIPLEAPGWTDHNLTDPGVTVVELLAWLTEMQLYEMNHVSERHRLKYLSLLGVRPREAEPVKVDVRLATEAGEVLKVPVGTVLRTDVVGPQGAVREFETEEDVEVLPLGLQKIYTYNDYRYTDVTEYNEQTGVYFHAMGETPQAGDEMYLGLALKGEPGELEGRILRLAIYPYEEDLPPEGAREEGSEENAIVNIPSAEVAWEYWTGKQWQGLAVSAADAIILQLTRRGEVAITIPPGLKPGQPPLLESGLSSGSGDGDTLIWMRIRLEEAGYEIPPRIDRLEVNRVTVTEGRRREEQWQATGQPYQEYRTGSRPVIPGTAQIKIDNEEWQEVRDTDASGPGDRHYTVDSAEGKVRFGDGIRGAAPAAEKDIEIRYRASGALKGNISAGAVTAIGIPGVTVTNPYPSYGGTEAESVDEAFKRFKKDLARPYVAVTAEDYETVARATPGLRVARAKAVLSEENQSEVIVVVVPAGFSEKPQPGPGFKKNVCQYLDKHRQVTACVKVCGPDYVKVNVSCVVMIKHGYAPGPVRERGREALGCFLSPRAPGQNGSGGWPFGRPVYRSEIHQLLEGVEGVDRVDSVILNGTEGIFQKREGNIEIGRLSLVYPGNFEIEIREPYRKCTHSKHGG